MLDELTGIYNRRGFYRFTEKLLREYPGEKFCLIYWNIRKFKVINELFGREAGDKILVRLAESIKKEFGGGLGTYGRLERDNFICCVPESVVEARQWMKLGDIFYFRDNTEYRFFSCYGLYRVEDRSMGIENMVDRARLAMESVRDDYVEPCAWYDESMWDSLFQEQKTNSEFQSAIEKNQFKVFYQPICRAEDGRVISAEALVRWEQPGKGLVSPGSFIPLFERNGFISVLDRYVWNEVCRMLRERMDKGQRTVPVSINVSRVEFRSGHLSEDIYEVVKKHGIPTNMIKIEITETAYSDDPKQVMEAALKLQEYGFVVLMDDFGSGYSSLNTLKDLPMDVLKIDMKFMEDFENNQKATIILEAVIRMAKWMKLSVVAEGVETRTEWDYLKSVNCDQVQGFFFHKPMPEKEFEILLDKIEEAPAEREVSPEVDEEMLDVFFQSNSQVSDMFYNMLGGMGILEMAGDQLEIIRVNKGFYEVLGREAASQEEGLRSMNLQIADPQEKALWLENCRISREKGCVQQIQVNHQRLDGSYVWLNVKLRYMGRRGSRALFYFTVENIQEKKQEEQEKYLISYSRAMMKVFDKVYRMDYSTGMAHVIHTDGGDDMEVGDSYYFPDFFSRHRADITFLEGSEADDLVRNKDKLDAALQASRNGTFHVSYDVNRADLGVSHVEALFLKVELESGREEYLVCIKRTEKE